MKHTRMILDTVDEEISADMACQLIQKAIQLAELVESKLQDSLKNTHVLLWSFVRCLDSLEASVWLGDLNTSGARVTDTLLGIRGSVVIIRESQVWIENETTLEELWEAIKSDEEFNI